MKKLLIITVFLGLALSSYSQLNYFLPDSNSYFSVSPYKFWFQGDTIIYNKKYKKVFQQNGDSIADFNKATYYAAVREDTLNEKIYCIQNDDGIERLISDFSLNVGDTVSVYSFWPFGSPRLVTVKIKSIDSILIYDKYRKRLNIDEAQGCLGEGESWIEGIGSTLGLFFPYSVVPDLGCTELLCVHINDTVVYQNPFYEDCYEDILLGIIETNQDFLEVYPTIVKDNLIVVTRNNLHIPYQYNILSTQGIKVENGSLNANCIDVSFLKEGFYFIILYDKKNKSKAYINKFIKF